MESLSVTTTTSADLDFEFNAMDAAAAAEKFADSVLALQGSEHAFAATDDALLLQQANEQSLELHQGLGLVQEQEQVLELEPAVAVAVAAAAVPHQLPLAISETSDDALPPPPPPMVEADAILLAMEQVAPSHTKKKRAMDPLAAKRARAHITRINKNGRPSEGGLRTGFNDHTKMLAKSMKKARKAGSGTSKAMGSRISTVGSKQATGSNIIREFGTLAAKAQFTGMSAAVVVTSTATGSRSGKVYSLGAGKFASILDLTIAEAIKLTSRPGTIREGAAEKLTLRALLESVEAAVPYPDVEHQMQLVGDDSASV